MGLNQRQWEFSHAVALLIMHAYSLGYKVQLGDAFSQPCCGIHKDGSFHYLHLAIDLNIFDRTGKYLTTVEDHKPLGEYWEQLGGTWGGRWKNKDANHYSWGE